MRDDDDDEAEFQRLQRAVSVHPSRVKSRRKRDQFVKVPLWWAGQAAQATGTPKAFVWIWLLHLHFKTHRTTFPMPNGNLQKLGVSRHTKRRALRELEAAGLITIVRQHGKTPIVSLMVL